MVVDRTLFHLIESERKRFSGLDGLQRIQAGADLMSGMNARSRPLVATAGINKSYGVSPFNREFCRVKTGFAYIYGARLSGCLRACRRRGAQLAFRASLPF